MTDYYDMAIRHPRKTAALIVKLKKDRIERQEYADKAEAKVAELEESLNNCTAECKDYKEALKEST